LSPVLPWGFFWPGPASCLGGFLEAPLPLPAAFFPPVVETPPAPVPSLVPWPEGVAFPLLVEPWPPLEAGFFAPPALFVDALPARGVEVRGPSFVFFSFFSESLGGCGGSPCPNDTEPAREIANREAIAPRRTALRRPHMPRRRLSNIDVSPFRLWHMCMRSAMQLQVVFDESVQEEQNQRQGEVKNISEVRGSHVTQPERYEK